MLWFPPKFSGALVNTTALTLLLENFAKKRFSREVLANTGRFLRFASLQTLRILATEGIANFGIALAKHCNLVFCSFVLQIDWWKPFLTEHASHMVQMAWHYHFRVFIMLPNDGNHRKKSAFPPYVVFMMKERPQFGWATSRIDDTRSYGGISILFSRGGQTCSMYEPHIVKPKLQRAATLKS